MELAGARPDDRLSRLQAHAITADNGPVTTSMWAVEELAGTLRDSVVRQPVRHNRTLNDATACCEDEAVCALPRRMRFVSVSAGSLSCYLNGLVNPR